ncbi:MAG: glycosyltransferase [Elainellaceae cyanobacterium]
MKILAKPAFRGQYKNPYTWSLYKGIVALGGDVHEFSTKRCISGSYDIFHIHWPEWHLGNSQLPEAIAKTSLLLLLIDLLRAKGTKIIWTVHNLGAHENQYPQLESIFWNIFTQKLDGYISLSHSGKAAAEKIFPNLSHIPGCVVPHSHYRDVYLNRFSPEESRRKLGISASAKVFLLFGRIKPYKNVPALIKAFERVNCPDAVLLIVGSFRSLQKTDFDQIMGAARLDPRILIKDEFVDNDDVHIYFQSADLVVLPYREILNSGSALLALSFDRPILVPELGSLGEVKDDVGQDWVQTYTGEISAEKLDKSICWSTNTKRDSHAPLDSLNSSTIAQKTYDFYRSICYN